jgi:FO synthase
LLSDSDIALLLTARGVDAQAVVGAADRIRHLACGDRVTFVMNRNINYTNVCTLKCGFCAFSKGKVRCDRLIFDEETDPALLAPT